MFLSQLNKYRKERRNIHLQDFNVINLNKRELDQLLWLSLLKEKRKAYVDKLGVKTFGPFRYYASLYEFQNIGFFHLIELEGGDLFYVILREIEEQLTVMQNENRKEEPFIFFDFQAFLKEMLIYRNNIVQNMSPEGGRKELKVYFDEAFQKTKEVFNDGISLQIPSSIMDDFIEFIIVHFFEAIFVEKDSPLCAFATKKLLYGMPLTENEWASFGKNKIPEIDLFFQETDPKFSISQMEKVPSKQPEAIHLHGNEWLLRIDTPFPLLWEMMLFAKVETSGQGLHLSFSNKTVEAGKRKGGDYNTWVEILSQLCTNEKEQYASLLALWEGDSPVLKKDAYIFYYIGSNALKKYLTHRAIQQLGKDEVMTNENGVFISSSVVTAWEKFLKDNSISFVEKEHGDKEEGKAYREISIHPPKKPREWEEIHRLPKTMFQLMMYKENMMVRMLRQSQALKLPVVMELENGKTYFTEIQSIHFHANKAEVETYYQNKVDMRTIRRIAICHPEKEVDAYDVL